MNSAIKELYEVAKEFARNPDDCSLDQYSDSLSVIELIEDGEHEKAFKVGLIY